MRHNQPKKPSSNLLGFVIIPVIAIFALAKVIITINRADRNRQREAQLDSYADHLRNHPTLGHMYGGSTPPPGMTQAEFDRLNNFADAAGAYLDQQPAAPAEGTPTTTP